MTIILIQINKFCRFFNAKSVKIVEESIVDPKNKVLITYTRNLGYAKVMVGLTLCAISLIYIVIVNLKRN